MSKFNSEPIDIIVPWVNPNDKIWINEYSYWKQKVTGECGQVRFRDSNTFYYWFRCIEKNMPWVRYVFLVLASPSQIPSWLNINNPKLKIIYHEQFIPKEELPTFNSSVINCYIPFINELSNNYILFNDDMFVIKPTNETDWFNNDLPVYFLMHEKYRRNGSWSENIINSKTIVKSLFNIFCASNPEHGPISNKKDINLFLWNKCYSQMQNALHNTKFRNKKNITDWIFFFFTVDFNKFYQCNKSLVHYNGTEKIPNTNKIILCANDTELIKNYNIYKKNLTLFLDKRFNLKSEFEI